MARARYLATQAREPAPHYEHAEIGFNYRMSNLLAALGRAQLRSLPERVARRRAIKARYRDALGDVPGIAFMPDAARRRADQLADRRPDRSRGVRRHRRRRPPGPRGRRHRGPPGVEADAPASRSSPTARPRRRRGRADLRAGLCLPSGSSLTDAESTASSSSSAPSPPLTGRRPHLRGPPGYRFAERGVRWSGRRSGRG